MSVIQGFDTEDEATGLIPADQPSAYDLDPNSLAGRRIGVWRLETGSPETDAITEQAVAALRAAGATPVDVELPYLDVVDANAFPALFSEFHRDIDAYLADTPGRHPSDLAGLIAFNEADPIELRDFGQELFEDALVAPDTSDPVYLAQREAATGAARASIDETLAGYDLDAIMAPTNSPAWPTSLAEGDAFLFGSSGPAAVAGYPNISVPAGSSGPLPVGMSFFGTAWSEASLLSIAYGFEQSTLARVAPELLPTGTA